VRPITNDSGKTTERILQILVPVLSTEVGALRVFGLAFWAFNAHVFPLYMHFFQHLLRPAQPVVHRILIFGRLILHHISQIIF
jgi:hypothetical protein